VRHNALDQAAARAAVVKAADLGGGWKGTVQAVTKPAPLSCPPSFQPRQDDLVVTGDVASQFEKQGVSVGAEVALLETAAMVRKDWSRTVRPQVVPCLASEIRNGLGSSGKVLSARKVPFPGVAPMASAYRVSASLTQGSQTLGVVFDFVLLGKGRGEVSLEFTYPKAAQAAIVPAERRLAGLVAGRIHV